jgi:hypothetical protein
MMIARDLYWVVIQHGGDRSSFAIKRRQPADVRNELELPVPELAGFDRWVAGAEQRIGKPFRRDKLWVQSNIKGGRDAIVKWIENGFTWAKAAAPPPRKKRR